MSRIFTNYDELENVTSEPTEKFESKEEKKLRKLLKKQRKFIRRLKKQESAYKNDFSTEDRETRKSRAKEFLSRVEDAFLKALPSIFRCAAKIIVTAICKRIFGRSEKTQVA